MSIAGRGRGYTGRHHMRPEPRPGDDAERPEDMDAARTLAELSPRSPDPAKETKEGRRCDQQPPPPPSSESDSEIKYGVSSVEDETALKELLTIDEQYRPLLTLLEKFSPGEDGIQFNRKLRHFETTVTNMCPDEASLIGAFSTFRGAALRSAAAGRTLAAAGAAFTRQQRRQPLRAALLSVVMQGAFAKLDLLERANPQFLINAANLMGDYFAEARLCNGNKVHILAAPLLQYMKALLVSNDIRAHRSLATQLMQNGRELLSLLAQELDDLSISIRIKLLTQPPVNMIWLLLSADLCLNKFLPLPNTLQQFYASHLDLIQEENTNYSEVTYGSWKKSPEKEEQKSTSESSDLSLAEKVSQNLNQLNVSQEDDVMKPKLRPILGAGAGLLRQEQTQGFSVNQDSFETWTAKSLSKRYDLNSWRQNEEEKKEEPVVEPVFNPSVMPPALNTVPDYPPPTVTRYFPPENYPNYLQQGDGTYIQSQFDRPPPFTAEYPQTPLPKDQQTTRRQPENWRKEKSDLTTDDANRNRQKTWNRRSRDNIDQPDSEDQDGGGDATYRNSRSNSRDVRSGNRQNRRNSTDNAASNVETKSRRHVSDVPRCQRYWDHDDRCDIDYTS